MKRLISDAHYHLWGPSTHSWLNDKQGLANHPAGDLNSVGRDYNINEFLNESKKNLLFCEGIKDGFYETIPKINEKNSNQCFELPCSENASIGMALGASTYGLNTILCFQRVEFALLALEQIANNSSKISYLTDQKRKNPALFRFVIGRGWGQGPSHSQSFETMFAQIPNINVVMPVFPEDTKFIFESFRSLESPTISLEHRWVLFNDLSPLTL